MKNIIGLSLLMICLVGCPTPVVPTPPSPEVPSDVDYCESGCKHLQSLAGRDGNPGCEESRSFSIPGGEIITCAEFCRQTLENGRNLYPSCWPKVRQCDEIESYRTRATPCSE
jgi:hypothetical protein